MAVCVLSASITVASAAPQTSEVAKGRYLAIAGNCIACHTPEGGETFAGGVPFETPFGTIHSTNITPDPQTGIGEWTEDEFVRALRKGIRANGDHLYPVFPYPAFTKISDEEASALFAYLETVTPVSYTPPENDLSFPYNLRWTLRIWKALYFEEERYVPDQTNSAEWNRGAYLVQGLADCGGCHTPRNFLGAIDEDLAMTGSTYEDTVDGKLLKWSATNLTSAPSGLGLWSLEDIAAYLKHGISDRASVFGPMNKVVVNSTRHLSAHDVRAIALYLKSLPAVVQDRGSPADEEDLRVGELEYDINCGTCHLPTGLGDESTGPPLVGSPVALAADPASLINITLYGAQVPDTPPSNAWQAREWQIMEPYDEKLNDQQIAAILSYVRSAWGNDASEVTPDQVADQR